MDGQSIGVFRVKDRYFGLRNRCPHQGGPVCEGSLFPWHRASVEASGRLKEFLDHERMVVCCPWHGWEFDVASGVCLADPTRGVQSFEVEVKDGAVVLTVPDAPPGRSPDTVEP